MNPQEPYRVRASSWGSLFDCAHKWEGTHLLGLRMPSGPRALLGTSIHAGTAAFDAARVIGSSIDVYAATDLAVSTIRQPEYDVDWSVDDITPKEAEAVATTLVSKYCREISPRYTFRSVELETKPFVIDCGNGVSIQLTGTLDRSRARIGTHGVGITDLKSGSAAVQKGEAKTKGHFAQIGTYELLYEHSTDEAITEPAEIIGLKTKGTLEIGTALIHDARKRMVGDGESPGLIQYAAEIFRTGLFPPNPQSMLCSPKYCSRWKTCRFHE